jgi:hypothetical protein
MADEPVVDNRRSFLGTDGVSKYFVMPPTANDIREADWHYSKVYTRSLTEGITTSAEMMDILRRRGIIGSEFEKRAAELTRNLNERVWDLEKVTAMDAKRDAAIQVAEARDELFQWNQRLNGPMSNTCENMADDARLEYLTSCMVIGEDNKRVWEKHDDYLKEKNRSLALKARFEVMLYLQGLESDFLERTPEAKAMKEIQAEILDKAKEAARALEATQIEKAADEAKATVTIAPEKPKKKRIKKS